MNTYYRLSLLTALVTLAISFYTAGYIHGVKTAEKGWQARLISADYAEYNKRTGGWELRNMDEVVTSALILGRGKLPEEKEKIEHSLLKK
jgi:hypothetical protein